MLLHYEETGEGPIVVLLHGMAASIRDWDEVVPKLTGHRVIVIDLLGFGHSPMPKNITYDAETHVRSIIETLNHLNVTGPFTLVGHSMGGLLALKLATTKPRIISRLILVSMPVYHSVGEARQTITEGRLSRKLAYYGLPSHVLCAVWCKLLRPVSSRMAHLYLKNQPKAVAKESVLHTWQSYNESMKNVIEKQSVPVDLQLLTMPTLLIYGDKERPTILGNASKLRLLPNARLEVIAGGHNLPIDSPDRLAQILMAE